MSALRANEWPLPCMALLKCGLLTFDRKTIADNPDFKSLEQERSRNLSRWGSHTWTWGDPTLTRPLSLLHLLEDRRKSAFSVRRDLSRQLKASDIYFVTFVTHGIVEERQRAKASLNQEELKRKREQSRQRQQNKDAGPPVSASRTTALATANCSTTPCSTASQCVGGCSSAYARAP